MLKIKVSTKNSNVSDMLKQSPNNDGVWGDAKFYINNDACTEADYWIIYDDFEKTEQCRVNERNVWLITTAPYVDNILNQYYLNQFAHIIIPSQLEKIKGKIHNIPAPELWRCGKTYSTLSSESLPSKQRFLSVISYNLYRNTLDFLNQLRERIDITVYGESPLVNYEDDNAIMSESKYHIVLENEIIDNYWTAALSRCYLNWAFPIYYGGNISNYFSEQMYLSIDINNYADCVDYIENFIRSNNYNQSIQYLMEARHRILNEYNFYPYMLKLLQENAHYGIKDLKTIRPRSTYIEFENRIRQQEDNNNTEESTEPTSPTPSEN